jgi:hypothetical protein
MFPVKIWRRKNKMSRKEETKNSGFATAGLVLGIIGACTSFIPIINNLSFILGILAIIFGIVALIKKSGRGKVIASIILGIVAIAITLSAQKSVSDSLDNLSKDLDKVTGNSTEEVLANDAEVTLGSLEVTKGDYGITNTKLVVTVKNKTSEKKSYNFHIEALDSNGSRIGEDYVYANDLNAGQSQNFEIFTYISSDKLDAMKNATFKIVEASAY